MAQKQGKNTRKYGRGVRKHGRKIMGTPRFTATKEHRNCGPLGYYLRAHNASRNQWA